MATLFDELAALATMSPAQLRAEWRRVYRTPPPRLTPDLLLRGVGLRLQERARGGLPTAIDRELDRMAKRLLRGDQLKPGRENRLKPGTRLLRHWNGKTHSVLVTNDGFVMDERRFTSLSHVAKAITGAHWSGPRFFGVRTTAATTGAAAASVARRAAAAAGASAATSSQAAVS